MDTYSKKLKDEIRYILSNIKIVQNEESWDITYLEPIKGEKITKNCNLNELYKLLQEDIIYQSYYKNLRFNKQNTLQMTNEDFKKFIEVSAIEANKQNQNFEMDWEVESTNIKTGNIIVKKRNYEKKRIFSGFYLNQSLDYPFKQNELVKVAWFKTRRLKGDNTYFYIHGQNIPDDYIGAVFQVRFYLNFIANESFQTHIQSFFLELIEKFNIHKIPFQLKILTILFSGGELKNYTFSASDPAVIYLENNYFFAAKDIILPLVHKHNDIFAEHVPMFTNQLEKGVSFAENPKQTMFSFGQSRAVFLTNFIINYFNQNASLPSAKDVINEISKKFPKGFYLNPQSYFPYQLSYATNTPTPLLTPNKIFSICEQIGYIICKEAIIDNYARCTWVGSGSSDTVYRTLDATILNGVAGVALFLNALYQESKDSIFMPVLVGSLNTLVKALSSGAFENIGFYKGKIGVLYSYIKISNDLGLPLNQDLINKNVLCQNADKQSFVILDGVAGEVMGLVKIYNLLKELQEYTNQLAIIEQCIKEKSESLLNLDQTIFYDKTAGKIYSGGYAQGLSGIGIVLIEAGVLFGDNNFTACGLTYILDEINLPEKSIFNPSWTHKFSKTGLGLVIVRLLNLSNRIGLTIIQKDLLENRLLRIYHGLKLEKVLNNDQNKINIEKVVTINTSQATCELALHTSLYFKGYYPYLLKEVYENKLASIIEDEIRNGTYKLELSQANPFFQTNLFEGIAAIGYSLLRIYAPNKVESMLILNP